MKAKTQNQYNCTNIKNCGITIYIITTFLSHIWIGFGIFVISAM